MAGRRSSPSPGPERPPATAVSGSVEPAAPEAPAAAAPTVASELLVCGRIGKPQGLRGEVTVEVRTDVPDERFAEGSSLLTEPPERGPLTVASSRYQNGRLVVRFEGVDDRTAAERLRETMLLVDAATLSPPEDPDEFLDVQLVGLRAELEDGSVVGQLREVLHLPGGDVLVVAREAGEALVPFVSAIVPVVDLAGGRVVLTPPPGLLDDAVEVPGTADAPPPPEGSGA